MIADGCRLQDAQIEHSVIGIRSQIDDGAVIKDSVLLGADYYESRWPLGIGKNCVVERAIIDKNARIGDGSVIRNAEGVVEAEGPGYSIHDGIVIVAKNVVLPPGTKI
jgi:glucose-1-phosphate adenylyltransferase